LLPAQPAASAATATPTASDFRGESGCCEPGKSQRNAEGAALQPKRTKDGHHGAASTPTYFYTQGKP